MIRKTESGQALVLTATALVALLAVMGLAIDMGVLRYDKRLQQTAADAAAIAGATNLPFNSAGSSGIILGAQAASAQNGFTNNTGGGSCTTPPTNLAVGNVTVTVCNPPIAGPHTGDTNYVEAYVSAGQPTYFMKVLGVSSETITARAVATQLGNGPTTGCLYTLGNPTASIEGVNINGSATLNASQCGIVDNGNFNTQGNALNVSAYTFGTQGTWDSSGPGGTVTCVASSPCPTPKQPAAADPIDPPNPCSTTYTTCTICPNGSDCAVADPAININGTSTCGTGCTYDGSSYTISPGVYSSITITGSGSGPTVNFQPGVYVIDGSGSCPSSACFNETGNATVNGTGVTFYFINNSTLNFAGTPYVNLTAPSTGSYSGMLMYQAPCAPGDLPTTCGTSPPYDVNLSQNYVLTGDKGPQAGGTSGSQYAGALYFPSTQLTFYGTNTSFSVGMVVSYSLSLSGNPTVNFTGPSGIPGGGPIKMAVLVE
jgi:Flp pilus assembly protein TadG